MILWVNIKVIKLSNLLNIQLFYTGVPIMHWAWSAKAPGLNCYFHTLPIHYLLKLAIDKLTSALTANPKCKWITLCCYSKRKIETVCVLFKVKICSFFSKFRMCWEVTLWVSWIIHLNNSFKNTDSFRSETSAWLWISHWIIHPTDLYIFWFRNTTTAWQSQY